VTLADGARIELRPISPADKALLADEFEHLSDESRYRRFLGPHLSLTRRELRYFTEIDHDRHEAIVAIDPQTGHGIGVARYIVSPESARAAEMAITVIDEWQGRGVGTELLRALVDRARANGVRRFTATVLNTNRPMLALFGELGAVELVGRDGPTSEFACELPEQGVGPLQAMLRGAASERDPGAPQPGR
jgi:RimJ/RimL family protein N-acetyltransferase